MQTPSPRGPLSRHLFDALRGPPKVLASPPTPGDEPLDGEDFNLSLYVCYQLHNRGFDDVDDRWEWSPSVIAIRRDLEARFERALLREVPRTRAPADIAKALHALIAADRSPSLSRYLEADGTPEEFREFVVHRSVYQLQEADPHTWAIPRLAGPAKAALVMIQADEYGNGRYDQMHSTLFEHAMRAFDLDTAYGTYVDDVPGYSLATVNLMSLFGLNRRWRGAIVGHLAAFEMTSTEPNLRYGNALRRFGYGPEATCFYDEHVTADETHARIAANDLAGSFARQEPALAADVLFGASALLYVEGLFAGTLLDAWARGASSLYDAFASQTYVA